MFFQKICRGHDLPGLAVAALGHVYLKPGLLHRVEFTISSGEALDGRDRLAFNGRYRGDARALCAAVDVYRTGAALTDATTELGARQLKVITQYPQQRRVPVALERGRR